MKKLKTQFRLNSLPYTLLKRNDKVALYGIGGEFSDKILHYEVDIIYIRNDQFDEREHIATNDTFGESGTPAQLMEKYGLDSNAIVKAVETVTKRK